MSTSILKLTTYSNGGPGEEYKIRNANIESYSTEPVMADDNMTIAGERFVISGTGLIDGQNWGELNEALSFASNRLWKASLPNPANTHEIISLTSETSNIKGPFCKITGTQVVGAKIVLVRFELTDQVSWCGNNPIVSHIWTQKFALDAAGRSTRTISGSIHVNKSSSAIGTGAATNSAWNTTAPIADLYRRALVPELLSPGWRRESQEYGYDATSTALMYVIVDKQHAHDLPNGVAVGNMEFSYERTLNDPAIGTLHFSCDLEANLNASHAGVQHPNRMLVEAAVNLSKTRIDANYKRTIITRMKVTEKEMLSTFAIRFELEAQVLAAADDSPTPSITALAYMIGQNFYVERTLPANIDAYGYSTSPSDNVKHAMVPHYMENLLNGMNCDGYSDNMPRATTAWVSRETAATGSISVTVSFSPAGVSSMNSLFNGRFQSDVYQPPQDSGGYTTIVAHTISTTSVDYDTGISRLSVMGNLNLDVLVQTRKPKILVKERVEISRLNQAPAKVVRPMPWRSMLVSENWDVSYGKFDAQGNRLFTGIYERIVQLYDAGPSTPGWSQQSYSVYGNLRTWSAPYGTVLPTIGANATSVSQATSSNVFDAATDTAARYSVPGETYIT